MLNGRCPECGSNYRGWALTEARHQICPKCGSALVVTAGGGGTGLRSDVGREQAMVKGSPLVDYQNEILRWTLTGGGMVNYGDLRR